MPSHIFTRIGYWKESIASNRASAKAAGDATFDAHHAFDYMVYAHLQWPRTPPHGGSWQNPRR